MATHPRVVHLLTVSFIAELLAPSYASANSRLPEECFDEIREGLAAARLHGPLCDAVWAALKQAHPELDDATLIERLAKALARKGGVRTKAAPQALEERMNALFVNIDLHIGRASDNARGMLESSAGRAAREKALAAAAAHLVTLFRV
ncbi:MAG: hypothetical protein AAB426_01205 [Myxococcota bacterium]